MVLNTLTWVIAQTWKRWENLRVFINQSCRHKFTSNVSELSSKFSASWIELIVVVKVLKPQFLTNGKLTVPYKLMGCYFSGWGSNISVFCGSFSYDFAAALWYNTKCIWTRKLCQGILLLKNKIHCIDWRDEEDNTDNLACIIPGLLTLEIPVRKGLGLSIWDSIYVVVGLSWCRGKE